MPGSVDFAVAIKCEMELLEADYGVGWSLEWSFLFQSEIL